MIKKIFLSILILARFSINSLAAEIIPWEEAHKYYGKFVTVEGTIVNTYNSGKACFLNFHPDWKRHFTTIIFASDFYKFPSTPEKYYYNKRVKITGTIREYQGKPEIILKEPTQIEIVQEGAKTFPEEISPEDFDTNELISRYENLSEEGKKIFQDYLKFLDTKYKNK